MARQVLPIAGAIVGGFFGQPQIGFMIGSMIGNAVDPQIIKGPSIGDGQTQTSQEGVPRPIVYGTVSLAGNLMDRSEIYKSYEDERQSKGGGPVVRNEKMHLTYAIRICEGPIQAVTRIWEDEKLVYDTRRDGQMSLEESAKYAERFRLYLGTEDQLPDPELEVIHGVGNVPSYRGTAYIVFPRNDVTDRGGSIPQYRFEVASEAQVVEHPAVMTDRLTFQGTGGEYTENAQVGMSIASGNRVPGFDITPDGLQVVAKPNQGSGPLSLYDVVDGGLVLNREIGSVDYNNQSMSLVRFSPDGKWLAEVWGYSSGEVNVRIYDANSFSEVSRTTYNNGGRTVGPACWSPHSNGIAVGFGYTEREDPGNFLGRFSVNPETGEVNFATSNTNTEFGSFANTPFSLTWTTGGLIFGSSGNAISCFSAGTCNLLGSTGTFASNIVSAGNRVFTTQPGSQSTPDTIREWSHQAEPVMIREVVSPINSLGTMGIPDVSVDGRFMVAPRSNTRSGVSTPVKMAVIDLRNFSYELVEGSNTNPGGSAVRISRRPFIDTVDPSLSTLGFILEDIADRCKINPQKLNTESVFETPVRGLLVAQQYSATNTLRSIQDTFFFDPAEWSERIHFVPRGGDVKLTLGWDDLVDNPYDATRKHAFEYPRKLELIYQNAKIGYDTSKAFAERNSPSVQVSGTQTVDVPIVLTEDEAAQVADKQLKIAWAEAEGEVNFSIPCDFDNLTPSDNIGLVLRDTVRRVRIEKIERADGVLQVKAKVDRQSAYSSRATGIPLPEPTPPPPTIVGETEFAFMNLPALIDQNDELGYYVAGTGQMPAWYGATVQRQAGQEDEFSNVATLDMGATMGVLTEPVYAASEHYPDTTNSLTVRLYSGSFDSVSQSQLLTERNAVAVVREDGTGEVLQFRDAEEVGAGIYRLSYLIRGRLNSGATGHLEGAQVVLLTGAEWVPASVSQIGQELTHRAVSHGESPETAEEQTDLWDPALSQTEFPVDLLMAELENGELSVRWSPRERFGTDVRPVRSSNWVGYLVEISHASGILEREMQEPQAEFDVSGLTGPFQVTVYQLNRLTGRGPGVSINIE